MVGRKTKSKVTFAPTAKKTAQRQEKSKAAAEKEEAGMAEDMADFASLLSQFKEETAAETGAPLIAETDDGAALVVPARDEEEEALAESEEEEHRREMEALRAIQAERQPLPKKAATPAKKPVINNVVCPLLWLGGTMSDDTPNVGRSLVASETTLSGQCVPRRRPRALC